MKVLCNRGGDHREWPSITITTETPEEAEVMEGLFRRGWPIVAHAGLWSSTGKRTVTITGGPTEQPEIEELG